MRSFLAALAITVLAAIVVVIYAGSDHVAAARSATGDVLTKTVAVGKPNLLPVGTRLHARFGRRVLRYQWLRCNRSGRKCRKIRGATHPTYVVRAADLGHALRASAAVTGNTIAYSAPTKVVGKPLPVNTTLPVITDGGPGTVDAPLVGDALSGSTGTWQHAVAYTFQWMDCDSAGANCTAITGATSQAYTIQDADVAHTIVFQVTAYNYQP